MDHTNRSVQFVNEPSRFFFSALCTSQDAFIHSCIHKPQDCRSCAVSAQSLLKLRSSSSLLTSMAGFFIDRLPCLSLLQQLMFFLSSFQQNAAARVFPRHLQIPLLWILERIEKFVFLKIAIRLFLIIVSFFYTVHYYFL